jgi:hypothetical protein
MVGMSEDGDRLRAYQALLKAEALPLPELRVWAGDPYPYGQPLFRVPLANERRLEERLREWPASRVRPACEMGGSAVAAACGVGISAGPRLSVLVDDPSGDDVAADA